MIAEQIGAGSCIRAFLRIEYLSRPISQIQSSCRMHEWTRFTESESYLEYGDTIAERRALRPQQLDALDAIFAGKRAQASPAKSGEF